MSIQDFYGDDINPGDWVYIFRSRAGAHMRFGRAERIGSTGKMLFQIYPFWNGKLVTFMINSKLVPIPDTQYLTWKVNPDMLPAQLKQFLKEKELPL